MPHEHAASQLVERQLETCENTGARIQPVDHQALRHGEGRPERRDMQEEKVDRTPKILSIVRSACAHCSRAVFVLNVRTWCADGTWRDEEYMMDRMPMATVTPIDPGEPAVDSAIRLEKDAFHIGYVEHLYICPHRSPPPCIKHQGVCDGKWFGKSSY